MNDNRLTLGIKYKHNNRGHLTFAVDGFERKMNGIVNILRFVGNMKQLSKAILLGADQDCGYEIEDVNGMEWVVAFRVVNGIVELTLWYQEFGFSDKAECWFDWSGTGVAFGEAVDAMIAQAGAYSGFLH